MLCNSYNEQLVKNIFMLTIRNSDAVIHVLQGITTTEIFDKPF